MDFASILGAEISKKRKTDPSPSSTTTTPTAANPADTADAPPPKKYLKRSEVEAQRRAEYLREQTQLESERRRKADEKRAAAEAEEARREAVKAKQRRLAEERRTREEERLGPPPTTASSKATAAEKESSAEAEEDARIPTEEEAVAQLRELGEPATLFGESHTARTKRLRRVLASRRVTPAPPDATPEMSEEEMRLDPKDVTADPARVYRQLEAWFRLVLREWAKALAERPLAVKESFQGKKAADAMAQARVHMEPLFRHFKNRDLEKAVFDKLCEIVLEAQARRYVRANDVYLRLSIGNAAWPIGVTMVGIHERSAREKLHEHQKGMGAHIMSDEVTRKFLQSIKRCLSFCQTRWPPEDPLQLMG